MRIWVTGIGVVSPLGRSARVTMDRMVAGDRAFAPLSLFELAPGDRPTAGPPKVQLAAEVPGLSADEVAPPGEAEGWSRTDAMSVIAAREALAEAGVEPARASVDLVLGGTTAGMFETEDLLAQLSRNPDAIAPLRRMLSHPLSSTADHVDEVTGPFRRVRSVCSACSSGANAILLAAAWIRAGASSCVLAGGADGLCRLTYTGFGALAALDANPCRPFDRRRAGLNLGEGAAFLVLEPEEAARARGARPIVELRGWAVGAEAHHITNPERSGRTAARVMRAALARAEIGPAELDYVNAHGTATPLNDPMEAAALHACLGAEVERVPVSSTKGQIGHTLGAAGAIEAAVTAMAIARGVLPPTAGLEEVDPECRLAHLTTARVAQPRAAMSNSFGFGGTDTVLVFTHPDAFPPPRGASMRRVMVTAAATVGPAGVLGTRGTSVYLEGGPRPAPAPIPFTAAEHLDIARARRLDRAGRLGTVAIDTALREAGRAPDDAESVGAIVGASFGSVDASTAYMCRIYDKGAKFASPADFPNLVPSSPVGHASIYLGLRGAVFAMADLGATAESAMITAAELVAVGEADALAAGSVEEASPMIERCLGPMCSGIDHGGVRSEGASVVLFESEERVRARGGRAIARLAWWTSWRGDPAAPLSGAPAPSGEFLVLAARDDARISAWLEASPWVAARRRVVAPRTGDHEGAGGFAVAVATSALERRAITSALVVGRAPRRGYALLFTAVE
jgi:3-oxoacyl-[acyl-carrier-protein] synthase II